jgi:hypothetical protein
MALFRGPALTLATVEGIFQRREWRYTRIDGGLLTSFEHVMMVVSVDQERETVLIQVPILAGKGMPGYRPLDLADEHSACVYLMARNFQLLLGNYGRDHKDGEIRFAVAVPVSGTYLSDDQVEHAILASVGTVTRDAAVLNAVLTGQMPLHQALAQLDRGEGPPHSMVV